MKFGAKKTPTVLAGGHVSRQISFKISISVEKKIVGISQYAYFSTKIEKFSVLSNTNWLFGLFDDDRAAQLLLRSVSVHKVSQAFHHLQPSYVWKYDDFFSEKYRKIPERSWENPGKIPKNIGHNPETIQQKSSKNPGKIPKKSWKNPEKIPENIYTFRFFHIIKLLLAIWRYHIGIEGPLEVLKVP
jgi:hypothetical protein